MPANLRPDERKCEELEKLRKRYHMPNDTFVVVLLGSPVITRRVQENAYTDAREQMPNASEKELLEAVFRSRVFPQNPAGLRLTEDQIQKEVQSINSLQDLTERVIKMEKKEPRFIRDALAIGSKVATRIDEILERKK